MFRQRLDYEYSVLIYCSRSIENSMAHASSSFVAVTDTLRHVFITGQPGLSFPSEYYFTWSSSSNSDSLVFKRSFLLNKTLHWCIWKDIEMIELSKIKTRRQEEDRSLNFNANFFFLFRSGENDFVSTFMPWIPSTIEFSILLWLLYWRDSKQWVSHRFWSGDTGRKV